MQTYKPFSKHYGFAAILAGVFGLYASAGDSQVINNTGTVVNWYKPPVEVKWQMQLQGTMVPNYNNDLFDIDLFDTPQATITQLHSMGKHVICYFSAGSSENWRPDFKDFLPSDMGKDLSGWPGEKWLDVRSENVRNIMTARMNLAVSKKCDGVDPDNVDGYSNKTGFPLTAADQINYDTFLATTAHALGLTVDLKNDVAQVKSLVANFDFAVNEQCHQYNECNTLTPFITAGKPVLNIEYQKKYVTNPADFAALCKSSLALKFSTEVLPLSLNGKYVYSCLP